MEDREARLSRIRGAFHAGWGLLRAGELSRVLQAFDPAIEYVDHRPDGVRPLRGHDELRELWAVLFGPDADVTLEADVVDMPATDTVLTVERYAAGGSTTTAHGLYTIRFGRIARAEFFAGETEARAAAAEAADRPTADAP